MRVPSFSLFNIFSSIPNVHDFILCCLSPGRQILDSSSNVLDSAYCYVSTTSLIVAWCKLRVRPVPNTVMLCVIYTVCTYLIYSLIAVQCSFFTLHQASPPRFLDIACCFSPLLFIVLNDCYYNATCKRYVLLFPPPNQFVVVDHDH